MNARKIEFDHAENRHRCQSSYFVTSNPRCNIIFGIIFIMFIIGMFTTSIVIALIKANWIELRSPFYNVDNDNIGNNSNMEFLESPSEITTVAPIIDGFFEKLSDLETSIESTTELTTHERDEDKKFLADTVSDDSLSCTFSEVNEMICEIICSNIDLYEVTNQLLLLSESELHDNCLENLISLKMVNITFDSKKNPWLQNTNLKLTKLHIVESSTFTTVYDESFRSSEFDSLKSLVMEGTGISSITLDCDECFSSAYNLEHIVVSNFPTFFSSGKPFVVIKDSLKELEISKISKYIDIEKIFSNSKVTKIEKLILENNSLNDSLTENVFKVFRENVTVISLSSSNISVLNEKLFSDCAKLTELDLSNNLIELLPAEIFKDLESLKRLFLQNNKLKFLPDDLFNTQIELGLEFSVNLQDNLWHCDLNILYLKKLLMFTTAETSDLKCSSPSTLSDHSLKDLWCTLNLCKFVCEHTSEKELLPVVGLFNTDSCNRIEMELKKFKFEENIININWLSDLKITIHTLSIIATEIKLIKSHAFNSETFKYLEELSINLNPSSEFVIEQDGLKELDYLDSLSFKDTVLTVTDENFLSPISDILKEISFIGVNSFNPKYVFKDTNMKQLRKIYISNSNFEDIIFDSDTFKDVQKTVEELFLIDSKVNHVEADVFFGFLNLKTINLNKNNFESIGSKFFGPLERNIVTSISISESKVKILKSDTFFGCLELENLDLSKNVIEVLPEGIFDNLDNLKQLNMEGNQLTSIPEDLFKDQANSGSLQFVNFFNNPWNCDEKIISLKRFLVNTEAYVEINECHNLNTSIIDIWCKRNSCSLFCETTEDLYLESILNIYNMTDCNEVELKLNRHIFSNLTINVDWLKGLNFKLHNLVLNYSNVEKITDNAFNSDVFDKLLAMTILSNPGNTFLFTSKSLVGLDSLESFFIDESKSFSLSYNIFIPIATTVKIISITNIAKQFDPNFISIEAHYDKLAVLNLSGNNFAGMNFTKNCFENINVILEEFYLDNSRITYLDSNFFSEFTNLRVISLHGNTIESINENFIYESKRTITSINISSASLVNISQDSLNGSNSLEILDLSDNLIQQLQAGTFDNLTSLKLLNLKNNKLKSIPVDLFNHQTDFIEMEINLMDNVWHCDENILYLKKFLLNSKQNVFINACVTPDKHKNQNIKDLWCTNESCNVKCKNTDENILPKVLEIYDKSTCETINLHLEAHSFETNIMNANWLSSLEHSVDKLTIEKSKIVNISNNVFISNTFTFLHEMTISSNTNSFSVESGGLNGLDSIESLSIIDSRGLNLFSTYPSILAPISKSVHFVTITNSETFDSALIFQKEAFKALKILKLTGNDFKEFQISKTTFAGCHEVLEELYLKSSRIKSLTEDAFSGFKNLKLLDLQENELTTLSSETFGNLAFGEQLKILIAENPWDCSAELCSSIQLIADENVVFCKITQTFGTDYKIDLKEYCRQNFTQGTTFGEITISTTTSSFATTTSLNVTSSSTTSTTSMNPTWIYTTTTINDPDTTTKGHETTSTNGNATAFTTPDAQSKDMFEVMCSISNNEKLSTTSPYNIKIPYGMQPQSQGETTYIQIPYWYIISIIVASESEVLIIINGHLDCFNMVYYQSDVLISLLENSEEVRNSIKCVHSTSKTVKIGGLNLGKIYTFCISPDGYTLMFFSPFQCKSVQISKAQPWLFEEHKAVVYTSLSLIIIFTLISGVVLTFCLIRHVPTLIKGNKRVVLVKNRESSEIFILPRKSTQSNHSSIRKDSLTRIPADLNEPPTYLTPLPRMSSDRPALTRSSSDNSLKSYVSVSRLPPRFSQVYQRNVFESDLMQRNGSYPCCAPIPTCSDIPPPLPRRSIVSTASSTQHSNASTAEIGRSMSRAGHQNSTYRRPPCPVEIEQENHYNVII